MSHTEELPPDGLATSTAENAESSSEEDMDELCCTLSSKELRRAVGNGIMKFGLELLENLRTDPKQSNIIISPLSVSLALSQLALGMFLTCNTYQQPNNTNLMHIKYLICKSLMKPYICNFSS